MAKFCDFTTLRPSDLITTLTYVLMDNFYPCFSVSDMKKLPYRVTDIDNGYSNLLIHLFDIYLFLVTVI